MIEVQSPKKPLKNLTIKVPGSKSFTNRAFLLAALAEGKSTVRGPLDSEDTRVMKRALNTLGIKVQDPIVYGKGAFFKKPATPIHLGNAGTAVRSLTAALATQNFRCTVSGNQRMCQRPIQDLASALNRLGANVTTKKSGCPPVTIKGPLIGGATSVKGSISSQYLSALLMAAPCAQNPVAIRVTGRLTSLPYVLMTLDTMKQFGVTVQHKNYRQFKITPQKYKPTAYDVEGDASSATYPLALAALHGNRVTVTNISANSRQADIRFLGVLKKMGCRIAKKKESISVKGPKKLKPLGTINLNQMPDAAMTVAILCAFAKGRSRLTGIGNLRIKESDRIAALRQELTKIGACVKEGRDWLEIMGDPDELHGAMIETYDDHRMAMCFGIAGSKLPNIKIINPSCVNKTYPTFWKELSSWGVKTGKGKRKENIVLSGLRGSGKSTIGKKLAQNLGYQWIDTDHLIEQKNRSKISEIVKTKGWSYFRKEEARVVKELTNTKKNIIATGGGIFINPPNIRALKKNGFVVLLQGNPDLLAKRIEKDTNRPRLTHHKNMAREMAHLWKERRKNYYAAADFVCSISENETPEKQAKKIALEYARQSPSQD